MRACAQRLVTMYRVRSSYSVSLWERGMPDIHMLASFAPSAWKKERFVLHVPVHEVLKVIINSL